jgi:hypothetical protein
MKWMSVTGKFLLTLMCSLALAASAAAATAESYDYPFDNKLVATILGTPGDYRAKVPKKLPVKEYQINVWPGREIPKVFWYEKKMGFSFVPQKKPAPLIFLIAGTGGNYKTSKMVGMQRALYQAGFHVLSVSSPTHPNFIVTASSTMVPGDLTADAKDLYQAMRLAFERVKKKVEVTEFYLSGYSLGAAESAFVAKLDEEEKVFNFRKVLMINPPLNLFHSVDILDHMFTDNIPGGIDHFNRFWEDFWRDMGNFYDEGVFVEFNEDLFYRIYEKETVELHHKPKPGRLETMIGFAFRISSANMIFTSDVMRKTGVIVPRDVTLKSTDSMTDFGKVTFRMSFVDYFNDIYAQYWIAREPGVTKEEIKERASLEPIRDYLARADKIGVMHNANDIILAPGEIDFFREVFRERAKIYPKGGHCGNMEYPDNVAYMVRFFQN